MKVKDIIDVDLINYKKSSMFIATSICNWKCCIEQGFDKSICQNSSIALQKNIDIPVDEIFSRYIQNFLTNAIVIGGLEPFLQFDELIELVEYFRNHKINDDIVIYTGYYPNEIMTYINNMKQYKNIIIKYGRYIPNNQQHYDSLLGVYLASNNQYAEKIS
jgi:organic radical activating enzyme